MIGIRLFYSLLFLLGLSRAFNTESFLKNCTKEDTFIVSLYFEDLKECLVCRNVSINPTDQDEFKAKKLPITEDECVVFLGGDVGVVNSDFFKQFPNTKQMTFQNVTINLKSSDGVIDNENIELLGILSSKVLGNHHSNALHSLTNLRKFVMSECQLEDQTLDGVFLQKNSMLKDVTILDAGELVTVDENLPIWKSIDEDAFENLKNLERVQFMVRKMNNVPSNLFKDKSKLKYAYLYGRFEKFPENIPDQIEELTLSMYNFERVTRDDFKRFKHLKFLAMYWSDLEVIDEDAFDDLLEVKYLYLHSNQIQKFTARHLKNNQNIRAVRLADNPIGDVNLSELGMKESGDKAFIKEQ